MLEQTQPQVDYGKQAESVIRHTQSREVSVLQPLVQAFFFGALPVSALVAAACVYFKVELIYTFLAMWCTFWIFFALDGRSRLSDVKSLIWNMESVFHVDLNQDGTEGQPAEQGRVRGERIDYLAQIIMIRHYVDRKAVTRDAMEAEGICSQKEWNDTNAILKDMGIKGEKDFIVDFATARKIYQSRAHLIDGTLFIYGKDGKGSAKIIN